MHRHLSYANVMATIAVLIALGGGAYAATRCPRTRSERHTAQRRRHVDKVKNGPLQRSDFRTADLVKLRGPGGRSASSAAGAAGATGDRGEGAGEKGDSGALCTEHAAVG